MKDMSTKRLEADTRQIDYESLTFKQRLAKLDRGGFKAVKERFRIEALMKSGKVLKVEDILSEDVKPDDKVTKKEKAVKQRRKEKNDSKS